MIRMRRTATKRFITDINITPLTDVCLVLLIIFMITASELTGESNLMLRLPKATTAEVPMPSSVTVRITRSGRLYVNKTPATFATLKSHLQGFHDKYGTRVLVIKADEGIPYKMVIQTIDLARQVGVDQVALATRQAEPVEAPR